MEKFKKYWGILTPLTVVMLCLPIFSFAVISSAESQINNNQTNVNHIYKLLRFIDWDGHKRPSNHLTICVVGQEPSIRRSMKTLQGKPSRWGAIKVVNISTVTDTRALQQQCHLVYNNQSSTAGYSRLSGIVSITSNDRVLLQHTMFKLINVQGQLKFKINNSLARRNGIRISSNLLALAVEVI